MKGIVIEDDLQFQEAIIKYLVGLGYLAKGVSSISQAIRIIDNDNSIQFCIIDINLSDGAGYEVLDYIKKHCLDIKSIIITGNDSILQRLKSFNLGADDYMQKPISPAELNARLYRLFKGVIVESTEPSQIPEAVADKLTFKERRTVDMLFDTVNTTIPFATLFPESMSNNAKYAQISRLRKKIFPEYSITIIYGRGYKLVKNNQQPHISE